MELSVAIDKLNSMTKEEIIEEAFSLQCAHVANNASECLIANLLRYWGVENVKVFPQSGIFIIHGDMVTDGRVIERYPTPLHVAEIIQEFDSKRI